MIRPTSTQFSFSPGDDGTGATPASPRPSAARGPEDAALPATADDPDGCTDVCFSASPYGEKGGEKGVRPHLPERPEGCFAQMGPDPFFVSPYGRPFWLAYASNAMICIAIAILYRYSDFVTYLGGTEFHLGWVVGVGMVGSVLVRLWIGSGIDRYGPRLIWLGSLLLFAATCFAHVLITDYGGVGIYVLRILYCTAMAGVFGAATTFVVGRTDGPRLAELISMLGTSGFLGMMLGTHLGDLICRAESLQRWHVDGMFVAAGLLGAAAVPFAWLSTRGSPLPELHRPGSLLRLVRRYQPGMVLVVGVATGAALVLPTTFLRTFAAELDIPRIGLFFSVVAITACVTRVLTRRLPDRLGLPRMILIGLGVMTVAQFLFLMVGREWQLLLPGLAHGIAQAILYPMVTAMGSSTFPLRFRGLGTTLVLATLDVGQLLGAPVAGIILHVSGSMDVGGYPMMFLSMSAVLLVVAGLYALTLRDADAESQRMDAHLDSGAILLVPRTAVPEPQPMREVA